MDRILAVERDLAGAYAPGVTITREGSIGVIATELASPLAMAVSELLHNAVEHSGASSITVTPSRATNHVQIEVCDDGRGLPDPIDEGLGLQIVRSLVEQDMRGELEFTSPESGGCVACVSVPSVG